MSTRYQVHQASFVVVQDEFGHILFHRRQNTGFMDGRFDLPSGHIDEGETAIVTAAKELQEETNLETKLTDLELFHVSHFLADKAYTNFFFKARKWQGQPKINEPEKCDILHFKPKDFYNSLELTPKTSLALTHLDDTAVTFSVVDLATYKKLGG